MKKAKKIRNWIMASPSKPYPGRVALFLPGYGYQHLTMAWARKLLKDLSAFLAIRASKRGE